MKRLAPLLGSLFVAFAGAAMAAPISPVSYDMRNGDGRASGGSFNYWDRNYNGTGATTIDAAPLTGGLGDLTDGVVAGDLWFNLENAAGTGPYVGWYKLRGADPAVVFNFAGAPMVDQIEIHVDNSNFGGVFAFTGVRIDGTLYTPAVPADGTHGWVTLSGLGLTGSQHSIQFLHESFNSWIFISEVRFSGTPSGSVPEPATLCLLGLGLLAGVAARRWRRLAGLVCHHAGPTSAV